MVQILYFQTKYMYNLNPTSKPLGYIHKSIYIWKERGGYIEVSILHRRESTLPGKVYTIQKKNKTHGEELKSTNIKIYIYIFKGGNGYMTLLHIWKRRQYIKSVEKYICCVYYRRIYIYIYREKCTP